MARKFHEPHARSMSILVMQIDTYFKVLAHYARRFCAPLNPASRPLRFLAALRPPPRAHPLAPPCLISAPTNISWQRSSGARSHQLLRRVGGHERFRSDRRRRRDAFHENCTYIQTVQVFIPVICKILLRFSSEVRVLQLFSMTYSNPPAGATMKEGSFETPTKDRNRNISSPLQMTEVSAMRRTHLFDNVDNARWWND